MWIKTTVLSIDEDLGQLVLSDIIGKNVILQNNLEK